MPLDIRNARTSITHEFVLPTAYAIQCPAPDPESTDFYVAQADKKHNPEDLLISRQIANPAGVRMRPSGFMRLVGAGHGTTISVLYRFAEGVRVLGIVCNAWGRLVWIPWVTEPVVKTDPRIVPLWPGWSYAYIDHDASTVCLRKGNLWRLHALDGDLLGPKIGSDLGGMSSPGPSQGYCTVKDGDDYLLMTLWDYGRVTSRPTIVVGSFATGRRLYETSARVLPKLTYPVTQEPEGAFAVGGVFHLGMSTRGRRGKIPMAVRFDPLPPPPPPPPPGEVGSKVTMYVRPVGDPVYKISADMSPRKSDGVTLAPVKRLPGFKVAGTVVEVGGTRFVKVLSGLLYNMVYLTEKAPK